MKRKVLIGAGLASAALAHMATTLPAQHHGMGMRGMPMGQGMGMMEMMQECPMMGMRMGGGMMPHAAGRVAFLQAELGIKDAQKGVWDAYAAALRKNLESMQGMHATMMQVKDAKSPVERLDAHIAAMKTRVASLEEVKPTLAALYAALDEEQKKKADQLLTGMGCMM